MRILPGSFSPKISEVFQAEAGGVAGDALTAGEVFFIYVYGLSKIGLSTTPGAVPPNYA